MLESFDSSWLLWIKLQRTWQYKYICKTLFWIRFVPGVGLLDHTIVAWLVLGETAELFSTEALHHFAFLQQCTWIPMFLRPQYRLIVSTFFLDNGHPDGCEVISHCGFDFTSLLGHVYWASFHMLVGLSSLEKCLLKSFAYFSGEGRVSLFHFT